MVGTLDCTTDLIGGWIGEIRKENMVVNLLPSPHGNHCNKYNKLSSKLKPYTVLFNDWSKS